MKPGDLVEYKITARSGNSPLKIGDRCRVLDVCPPSPPAFIGNQDTMLHVRHTVTGKCYLMYDWRFELCQDTQN